MNAGHYVVGGQGAVAKPHGAHREYPCLCTLPVLNLKNAVDFPLMAPFLYSMRGELEDAMLFSRLAFIPTPLTRLAFWGASSRGFRSPLSASALRASAEQTRLRFTHGRDAPQNQAALAAQEQMGEHQRTNHSLRVCIK